MSRGESYLCLILGDGYGYLLVNSLAVDRGSVR